MNIVAFGDSITEAVIGIQKEENWLLLLEKMCNDPSCHFFNAGVGGNSAREAMARFEKDVLAKEPDLIFLEFGGNNHDPFNKARHVEDEEFIALLEKFRSGLPEGCKVVVVTFPPVISEKHAIHKSFPDLDLDAALHSQRDIVRAFAKANNYPLLDLYKLLDPIREEMILPDGVHLNAEGNKFFAEKMYELLKQENLI